MVKSIYKNFLLAAVSSLITMFFIEISMSVFVGKNPSYYSARLCYDSDFDYYYCPDKIYKNKLSEYDGSEIIFDYTNFQGIPISKDKNKEKNYLLTSDVFIIGDSFIQADEIHYNQRMASYLRKENINAIEARAFSPPDNSESLCNFLPASRIIVVETLRGLSKKPPLYNLPQR